MRARVYAGETFTSSQVFDAVGLRGIALKTDDNMLPASLSGYAPEVRGIARSNATVTVRQNGNVIYQTSVPPGAFVLKDLYPTSSGGDLAVTIQESDGSQTQYTLPFASVPNLVRNGQVKYALGAGNTALRAIRSRPPSRRASCSWAGDTVSRFMAGRSFPIATTARPSVSGRISAALAPTPSTSPMPAASWLIISTTPGIRCACGTASC